MTSIDLITGASGLLGANLVRTLANQGRRVRVLLRSRSKTFHLDDLPNIEKVYGDITNPQSLETAMHKVNYVYHCAAQVSLARKLNADIVQTNVEGTQHVLDAAQKSNIRRLIYCSTVDALGLPENGTPSTEETPWNWERLGVATAYARTKYAAHQRVLAAARNGLLDVVLVCPTFMLGAFDLRPSSGQLILTLAHSRFSIGLKGGNNFVDVQDVVDGMITASETGRTGETYILGHANLPYNEIFTMISSALGKKNIPIRIPYPVALLAGKCGDVWEEISNQPAALNSALARLGYLKHYYDPGKAIRELNLPQRPIENAIHKAIDWFQKTGML
jgi:dihydroflavonol-4-reductase